LATHRPGLAAAFVFYGSYDHSREDLARVGAPVYGFYGGNDVRINATIPGTETLMKELDKTYEPVLGGALGLGAHSAKAGARLLVNTSPEPVSNSIVSVAEDFGVVGLLVLIYAYPWAALGVVLGLIALMAAVMPMLFRVLRFLLGGIGGMMASLFGAPKAALTEPPDWLAGLIPRDAAGRAQAFPCFARRVRGAPRLQPGYLVVSTANLQFVFKTLLGGKAAPLMEDAAVDLRFKKRLLFDTLFVTAGGKRSVICVSKDWSAAVGTALHLPHAPDHFGAPETLASRQT
jgi:hypothetical protein